MTDKGEFGGLEHTGSGRVPEKEASSRLRNLGWRKGVGGWRRYDSLTNQSGPGQEAGGRLYSSQRNTPLTAAIACGVTFTSTMLRHGPWQSSVNYHHRQQTIGQSSSYHQDVNASSQLVVRIEKFGIGLVHATRRWRPQVSPNTAAHGIRLTPSWLNCLSNPVAMSFTGMSASAKEDMVVSLATLVLHDGGKEITVRQSPRAAVVVHSSAPQVRALVLQAALHAIAQCLWCSLCCCARLVVVLWLSRCPHASCESGAKVSWNRG